MTLTSYDPSLLEKATALPPKLVSFVDIEAILTQLLESKEGVERILQSQQVAYKNASGENPVSTLPIQTAGQPPQPPLIAGKLSQVCIKTGYVFGDELIVSKVATGGGDNTGNSGAVFVLDQRTLRLSAVLCDEGLLTEVRTAAACVYASRAALLRYQHYHKDWNLGYLKKIGMIGGGVQAVWHLRLLAAAIFDCSSDRIRPKVVLKTRSKESASEFINRMSTSSFESDRLWEFLNDEQSESKKSVFSGCHLIHTVTPSRASVLKFEDLGISENDHSFVHITACGADSPGKCELDPELISKFEKILLCDSAPQSRERGEFQVSRFLGIDSRVLEIGQTGIIDEENGRLLFTEEHGFLSIFDSSGLALQDLEMAKVILNCL